MLYKIVWESGLQERTQPSITAPTVSNAFHAYGEIVEITRIQVNIAGQAVWGQLENTHWIQVIWNSVARAVAYEVDPPVIDPPPAPQPATSHHFVVDFDANGAVISVNVDGARFERV